MTAGGSMFSVTIRERSGQVYTFHFDKPEILIGRVKGNDVILPKQNISKRHALIRAEGTTFVVEDFGSTNGTFVNGHRITDPVEIGSEDKVYLGDFVMQFYPIDAEARPESGGIALPPIDDEPLSPFDDDDELPSLDDFDFPSPTADADPPAETKDALAGLPIRRPPPVEDAGDDLDDPFLGMSDVAFGAGAAVAELHRSAGDIAFVENDDLSGASVMFDARNAATVAELQDEASAARAALDAAMSSAASEPAVASDDPFDLSVEDSRSTGPLDGLSAHLDALEEDDDSATVETAAGRMALPNLGFDPSLDHAKTAVASPAQIAEVVMAAPNAQTGAYPAASAGSTTGPTPAAAQTTGPHEAFFAPPQRMTGPIGGGHYDDLALLYGRAQVELRGSLSADVTTMSDEAWGALERGVGDLVVRAARAGELSPRHDVDALRRDLVYELTWLGPLESLLDDAAVERIEVDGFDRIAVVRSGIREISTVRFSSQAAWLASVTRLVQAMGVGLEPTAQRADGALADGTVVQLVWPPLAPSGPLLVLRKPRSGAATLDSLVERGWMLPEIADKLRAAIEAGRSIAVISAPCEARRLLVESLVDSVPAHERLALVERESPLTVERDHVFRIAARRAGDDAPLSVAGRLGADRLVCVGADRALLAELVERGCEGGPAFIASWTGWDAADATRRAAHTVLLAHAGLERLIAFERVAMALDVVVVMTPTEDGGGHVEDVVEVAGAGPDGVELRPFEG